MAVCQVYCGRYAAGTNATSYASPQTFDVQTWTTTEVFLLCRTTMTFRNWTVRLVTPPGAGKSWTYTIMKNGSPTSLSLTISDAAQTASNTGNVVTLEPGDTCSVRRTSSGAPAATESQSSIDSHGTVTGVSWYANTTGNLLSTGSTVRTPCFSPRGWQVTVGTDRYSLVAAAGTLTHYGILLSVAPAIGKSYTFNIYKNGIKQDGGGGTVNTTITISDTGTVGDSTFSLPLAAGDRVYAESAPSGTPASTGASACFLFTATTDGESNVCASVAGGMNGFSDDTTQYKTPTSDDTGWSTTNETSIEAIGGITSFDLYDFRARMNAAPSGSLTIDTRQNAASPAGTPTVTLDTTTEEVDAVNDLTISSGQTWAVRFVLTGSIGLNRVVNWSWVQFAIAEVLVGVCEAVTFPASLVTETTARLSGTIDPNGVRHDGFFVWGPSNPPTENVTALQDVEDGLDPVEITADITGLTLATIYYFYIIGRDDGSPLGECVGTIRAFQTLGLGSQDEVLEGQHGILAWMEWQRQDVDGGSPTFTTRTTYYSDQAMQCPPVYYGGFKEARVERFGEAERAASNWRTGDWKGSTCQLRLSDFDQSIRARLGSAGQRFWITSVVAVRIVSRPTRAVLGTPLTVFVGPVRQSQPVSPLSFDLELQDAVGQQLASSQLLIPNRLVDPGFFDFELADAKLTEQPEPIIYGIHERAQGAFTPIYLGVRELPNGSPGTPAHAWLMAGHALADVTDVLYQIAPPDQAPEVNLAVAGAGNVDNGTHRYAVSFVLGAQETALGSSSQVTVVDKTVDGQVAGTKIPLGPGGTTARKVWRTKANGEQFFLLATIGDNTTTTATDNIADASLGAAADNSLKAFLSALPYEGTAVFIPHYAGFLALFGNPYEDFTHSTTGEVRRMSILYSPVGVKVADDVAAGKVELRVNVYGREPVGNGSGVVITKRLEIYEHFLINEVAHAGTESYREGFYLSNPQWNLFDVQVPVVDQASFAFADLVSTLIYPAGSPGTGYVGGIILGATPSDRLPARDWIARFNLSCDVRFGVKRYGQLFVFLPYPMESDRDNATRYTDALDILKGTFETDVRWDEHANRIPFVADYNYAEQRWEVAGEDGENGDSIIYYQRDIIGDLREYWMVQDFDAGKFLAEREAARTGHPPRVVKFETALGTLTNKELGAYIRYEHFGQVGTGSGGSPTPNARLAQIEKHTILPGRRRVRVEAVDVDDLVSPDLIHVIVEA